MGKSIAEGGREGEIEGGREGEREWLTSAMGLSHHSQASLEIPLYTSKPLRSFFSLGDSKSHQGDNGY